MLSGLKARPGRIESYKSASIAFRLPIGSLRERRE